MRNRVKVTVCGKEYALQTEESASYLIGLARKLDRQINDITEGSDSISMVAATVLAALSALDDAEKANESIDNIRTQIKDYVDEAGRARLERDKAVEQANSLKKQNELLKTKLACYENDLKLKKLKDSI